MASTEAILVTLMPTLNKFLAFAITLEVANQNNFSKSQKFQEEGPQWSSFIVSIIITYGIVKLYYDSLKFDLSLDSFQFKLYIVVINLVKINRLI